MSRKSVADDGAVIRTKKLLRERATAWFTLKMFPFYFLLPNYQSYPTTLGLHRYWNKCHPKSDGESMFKTNLKTEAAPPIRD